ncbi:peptidase M16 [Spirochaetia bacterium]|nr:peptidase M16 [Spirochaetia bacterium]
MKFNKKFTQVKKFAAFLGLAALVMGIFACASAGKAALKPGIEAYGGLGRPESPLPFMEAVRTGKLPNGLTYFILENAKPENRAYLTLAVNAGSLQEKDDEQGLAHFVEHMAFNGTARFPEAELINYLRSLGMRFGPEVNAYTSYDRTVYGIEVPVESGGADAGGTIKRVPEKALAVLDDWTRAITFDPKDVDEERLVVMEEYRTRLGAMDRVRKQLLPTLFRGSAYANRSPIGLPEIIENAPAARLENFYKQWYRPDNMALIIAGDFDGAALEAELASHFTGPAPAGPLVLSEYELPAPKKGKFEAAIITDPELTYTQLNLYYKRAPQPLTMDLAGYREGLIDTLIDRMLGLRFDEASYRPETPYVGAGAWHTRYGKNSRYYILAGQAKTGAAEATLQELLREKESMIRYGFTAGEITIAKGSLVSDLEQLVSEKDRQESNNYISGLTEYFLAGESFPDIEWELDAVKKLLPGIGVQDIAAAAKDYFQPGDLLVFLIAPEAERAGLPAEDRIRQLVKESPRLKIARPVETITEAELLPWRPVPGEITAESTDAETGAIIWELGNGAKVILKETKNRNNEIRLYAMALGGTTSAAPEEYIAARYAVEMAAASGLGPYSRPELAKKMADKQASIGFWTSSYYRGLQGSATTGDLKTLFEMVYLGITDPRIDPEAVSVMMDQVRTALAQRNEDPNTVFSDEVNKIINGGHPYFKPLELSDLLKLDIPRTITQAEAFLRRSLNPADSTFIFTGNIDTAVFRPLVETYLASIPRQEVSWNSWTNLNLKRPGKIEQQVYKGKEEQSLVFMGWYGKELYSEETSVISSVLTEYLDIRMTEDIREKLGGVYSVSVWVSASPAPEGELIMNVYFSCDPRRAEELCNAINELLGRIAALPIDEDTFKKSVEALKKSWEASVQSNAYIAQSYANSAVLLDTPLSRLDKRPALYEKVTPRQIQELCRRLLQNGPARIILYPEGWK